MSRMTIAKLQGHISGLETALLQQDTKLVRFENENIELKKRNAGLVTELSLEKRSVAELEKHVARLDGYLDRVSEEDMTRDARASAESTTVTRSEPVTSQRPRLYSTLRVAPERGFEINEKYKSEWRS